MTSVEALDFAIRRLILDRGRFVNQDNHNAALETLTALRNLIAEREEANRDL